MCVCDLEPADVLADTWQRARKEHVCYECYRTIAKGERYRRRFWRYDGSARSVKQCALCVAAVEAVEKHDPCACMPVADYWNGFFADFDGWDVGRLPSLFAIGIDEVKT